MSGCGRPRRRARPAALGAVPGGRADAFHGPAADEGASAGWQSAIPDPARPAGGSRRAAPRPRPLLELGEASRRASAARPPGCVERPGRRAQVCGAEQRCWRKARARPRRRSGLRRALEGGSSPAGFLASSRQIGAASSPGRRRPRAPPAVRTSGRASRNVPRHRPAPHTSRRPGPEVGATVPRARRALRSRTSSPAWTSAWA